MWQIADLHLARPQGLWASLRYPVQSDRQLGPADDTGRPRHRLHVEDDDHTTIFSGFCISGGWPVARVMSRDRSELRSQRADNTSGATMCVLSCLALHAMEGFSFWPLRRTSWLSCLQICCPRTSGLCWLLLSLRTHCCARGSGVRHDASVCLVRQRIHALPYLAAFCSVPALTGKYMHFWFFWETTSCPLSPAVTLYAVCMLGSTADTCTAVSGSFLFGDCVDWEILAFLVFLGDDFVPLVSGSHPVFGVYAWFDSGYMHCRIWQLSVRCLR